jgi:hypothetical protein
MSHFEGREWSVSGLEGHRDFARALTASPPAEFKPTQNLSVEFLTRINDTEIVQELADAFRTNQWLTSLTLLAHDADDLVPILNVLPNPRRWNIWNSICLVALQWRMKLLVW